MHLMYLRKKLYKLRPLGRSMLTSEFETKLDWKGVSRFQKLSEKFIIKFEDRVDFESITQYQYNRLSINFIRKYQNKMEWEYISRKKSLPEDFMIEFKDKLNWKSISRFQYLEYDFIKNNIDKLDIDILLSGNNISDQTKEKLKIYCEIL